jgi:hypothetical protein
MFGSRLAVLLGFDVGVEYKLDQTYIANYAMKLRSDVDYLCMYMPLLDAQQVGSVKLPLLRMVPFDNTDNPRLNYSFIHPYYCQVKKNNIESIRVITRDQLGRQVLFHPGKLFLTCHLRIRET